MTKIEDIEKAVSSLSPEELLRFRAWFEAFEAERFDARLQRDIGAGKLDGLAKLALDDLAEGRVREI